ncbi:hypothetical protein AAVH_19851 [Aphelenchoides avenae]|nr:hypothetical protein AAVH_19851 [Aphelenchus avenae]
MITFLVLRGKREPAFREAFYVQFMAVSIVDCLRMALLICDKLNDAANVLYGIYSPVVLHIMYIVPTYAQSMLHLLIAINRLTAFFYPLDHSTIWSNRVTATTIAVAVALSILLHFAPFYLLPLFYTGSMFCMVCNDEKWNPLTGYQAQDGIFYTDAWKPWFEPFHAFSLYVTEERLAEVLSLSGTPFLLLIR